MTNLNQHLNTPVNTAIKKKPNQIAEKRRLYEQWKVSGLGKGAFAKQNGLSPASFYQWCRHFSIEESQSSSSNFKTITVVKETNTPKQDAKAISVMLKIGRQMSLSLSMIPSQVVPFVKELNDAVNTSQ